MGKRWPSEDGDRRARINTLELHRFHLVGVGKLQRMQGVGVATQKPELRQRLDIKVGAERLARFFGASIELMQVLARACGHNSLAKFSKKDVTTWKREMAALSGARFAGVSDFR